MKFIGKLDSRNRILLCSVGTVTFITVALIIEGQASYWYHATDAQRLIMFIVYLAYLLLMETPIHEFLHYFGGKLVGIPCEVCIKDSTLYKLLQGKFNREEKFTHPFCRPINQIPVRLWQVFVMDGASILLAVMWFIIYRFSNIPPLLIVSIFALAGTGGDITFLFFAIYKKIRYRYSNVVFIDTGEELEAYINETR